MNKLSEVKKTIDLILEELQKEENTKKEIINATPHDITIFDKNGKEIYKFPKSGIIIRKDFTDSEIENSPIEGVPAVKRTFKEELTISGGNIPNGAIVFVSMIVADTLKKQRPDITVVVPDTSPQSVVRDDQNRILGVKKIIVID